MMDIPEVVLLAQATAPVVAQAVPFDAAGIGQAILNWGPPGVLCAYLFWQLNNNKAETKQMREGYEARLISKDELLRTVQEARIAQAMQTAQTLAETNAAIRQSGAAMEQLIQGVNTMSRALEVQQRVGEQMRDLARSAGQGG